MAFSWKREHTERTTASARGKESEPGSLHTGLVSCRGVWTEFVCRGVGVESKAESRVFEVGV